jgi:hypothetical protein
MKKWLVVHSLESYEESPKRIGFGAKSNLDGSPKLDESGKTIPVSPKIFEMKPGDRVVYYCKGDSVIKGIYEIVKLCGEEEREKKWPDALFQFEITPIYELDEPYNFKLLVPSLKLFEGISDTKRWGAVLQGAYGSIRLLDEQDYREIEKAVIQAEQAPTNETEEIEERPLPDYREHLRIQHEIADWGVKQGYRVCVATNDKNAIKSKLGAVLDEMPKFHRDAVIDLAKRIDVVFFDPERDVLTHAFEIEHSTGVSSGLLRLNDIAESYPSANVKFYIVSDEENRDKFEREIIRPSFKQLRKCKCEFREYRQVEAEWKELQKRKPSIF